MAVTGPVSRMPSVHPSARWLALAVAFAGIVAFAIGFFTHRVLIHESLGWSMGCGLRACVSRYHEAITTTSTFELVDATIEGGGRATAAWSWSGAIAWWAGVVAVVGLVLAGGMVAVRRYFRLPVMAPTTLALLGGAVALCSACVFIATRPETGDVGLTRVGVTFWSFGGGAVAAIIGAVMLSRQLAILEPEFDPGEAPLHEPWDEM